MVSPIHRSSFLWLISLLIAILPFQNCAPHSQSQSQDQSTRSSSKDSVGTWGSQGNGDGYHGKIGIYVSGGQCPSVIEVRADGVYQIAKDCNALSIPEMIDTSRVYFAEGPAILLVDGIVYHYIEGRAVSQADSHYAYYFCTNRFQAKPDIGVEVRMVQPRSGAYLHAEVFVVNESATPRLQVHRALVSVEPDQAGGFQLERSTVAFSLQLQKSSDPNSSSTPMLFQFLDKLTGVTFSQQVECWKGH